jgi:uncharacterized lipoprotein YmbA
MMGTSPIGRIGRILLFISLCFLGGCRHVSPTVHFYTLSAMESSAADKVTSNLKVVVGPVRIPGYLDRPQITIRTSENQVRIVEYHRWADSLKERISWEMAENLGVLLKSDHVSIHSLEASPKPDYQVIINFRKFDGWLGDRVRVGAYWEIRRPDTPRNTRQEKTTIEEPVTGQTYQAMVDAMSLALQRLSRNIAGTILEMHQKNGS